MPKFNAEPENLKMPPQIFVVSLLHCRQQQAALRSILMGRGVVGGRGLLCIK